MTNPCVWFEIPVLDIERARAFYSAVLDIEMEAMSMGEDQMAMFPMDPEHHAGAGALVQSAQGKPSVEGCRIYLGAGQDLTAALGRVEGAGGKVVMDKTSIGEHGFIAFFIDTEGNQLGLHSPE